MERRERELAMKTVKKYRDALGQGNFGRARFYQFKLENTFAYDFDNVPWFGGKHEEARD